MLLLYWSGITTCKEEFKLADQRTTAAPLADLSESAGSLFWFLMDGCWMWDLSWAPYLAIPAILLHLPAAWQVRRNLAELMVSLAILCWLAMNAAWVVSDMLTVPSLMLPAKIFFLAGGAFISVALAIHTGALNHFRRLRIGPLR